MLHSSKVTRVIDADTFCCTVDLDFAVSINVTVRLNGVDAWEVQGSEKEKGLAAKAYVETIIGGNTVQLNPYKRDSFGRWLCDVYFKGEFLADMLAEKGYLKSSVGVGLD
jgi:endonuclease YncB( thermonuclease family)